MKKALEVGCNCVVRRPETAFTGTVEEARHGWVRVVGKGTIFGTIFNEWFPIWSKCIQVEPL